MSGQIHRIKKDRDYVQLDTYVLRDKSLSWKAKGLHSYLMQLPDDWQIFIADLQTRSTDGRDSTANGLNELVKKGYIVRRRVTDENNLFSGYEYNVFERPEQAENWFAVNGKSVNGKSVNGKSVNGKSVTTNNESNQELNTENIKEESASASGTLFPPFKHFSILEESERTTTGGAEAGGETIFLDIEEKEKLPPVAPAPPQNGAALRITMLDPDFPGVKVLDEIPTAPTVPPTSTGRVPKPRHSQTRETLETVQKVLDEINNLKGGRGFKIKEGDNARHIAERIKDGATLDEMLLVVRDIAKTWSIDEKRKWFDPITPFRKANFYRYLTAASDRANALKQQAQPAQKTTFARQETYYEPSPYKKF